MAISVSVILILPVLKSTKHKTYSILH